MSRIPDLGASYANLPNILAEYEAAISDATDIIKLTGKRLDVANMENPSWQLYFDQKRIELGTLVKFFEQEVQKVRGRLYMQYRETYSIGLSEREIVKYIDHEKSYLDINELLLEIKELHDRYVAIVDAIKMRGYALNNITKIRVANIEHLEL